MYFQKNVILNQNWKGNRQKLFSVEKSTKFWSKLDPNEAFLSENDFFSIEIGRRLFS